MTLSKLTPLTAAIRPMAFEPSFPPRATAAHRAPLYMTLYGVHFVEYVDGCQIKLKAAHICPQRSMAGLSHIEWW